MAASMHLFRRGLCRLGPAISHPIRHYKMCLHNRPVRLWTPVSSFALPSHSLCTKAVETTETLPRYQDKPWEYLDSEEYIERYGNNPVWTGYRRNHKGGIPPQKTRKTCIRGDKICGNPCPICRDPNVIINFQNVKLLQQFINPHTGIVYDPTRTGVCMKQQKILNNAIKMAQEHGLLPFQIPYVEFAGEDYSNSHPAVGCTPLPPASAEAWYPWYDNITPDEKEVAKVKKIYKKYLK